MPYLLSGTKARLLSRYVLYGYLSFKVQKKGKLDFVPESRASCRQEVQPNHFQLLPPRMGIPVI